ncbi:MAG TPA: hypothetical protein VN718_00160 [Rhizomicrobium sp.]|nr:hypothetical protein [Rhizomicrobium sp.]
MRVPAIASGLLGVILVAPVPALAQAGNGSGTTFLHCVDPNAPAAPIDVTVDFAHNTANNLPATMMPLLESRRMSAIPCHGNAA